jgi:hypothetical protein
MDALTGLAGLGVGGKSASAIDSAGLRRTHEREQRRFVLFDGARPGMRRAPDGVVTARDCRVARASPG